MVLVTLDDLAAHVAAQAHSDDSLDRLDTALTVAAALDNQADALIDRFVAQSRAAGRSWTDIGARLGVTKQAARKRFVDPVALAVVLPPDLPLSPRLQTCLAEARRHAQRANAANVGTEHLLLASLLAEGVAAAILHKLGVTAEAITASAQRLFGTAPPAAEGPAPLSPAAVCAIEAAAHHAQAAGRVGTEHLLAALIADPGSRARRILTALNADKALIKQELACHIGGQPLRRRRFGRGRRPRSPGCAFCGATETTTRRLAHGPGVAICGTCAERASQAVHTPTP